MLASFRDVVQKAGKSGLLDFLKLSLHVAHIGSQFQLQTIIEVDFVRWVNAAQIEMIAHPFTERRKGFFPNFGHEKQGRANIKAVSLVHELVTASARSLVFLQHDHVISVFCESGGGGDSAYPGANYESSSFVHFSP